MSAVGTGHAQPAAPVVRSCGGSVSTAVGDLLEGPRRPGRVLGAFPLALYLEVAGTDGRVLALVAGTAVRLPNAVVVPAAARTGGLPGSPARIVVGGGEVRLGGTRVTASRWWDPVPDLPATTRQCLAEHVGVLRTLVQPGGLHAAAETAAQDLEAGVRRLDVGEVRRAVPRLVGAGTGLTPAGDDILAGLLAGLRLLPATLHASAAGGGALRLGDLADAVADAALPAARTRTTLLSAGLLAHAARGEVAAPMATVFRALGGWSPLVPAVERLHRLGHSSGRDLARGALAAAEAVLSATAMHPFRGRWFGP